MTTSPPRVKLGQVEDGGVAPAIMAIVDRGARCRPRTVAELHAEIELNIEDRYPPVRIAFGDGGVLVEDGASEKPDLRITGALPDLVSLMVAPLVGGVPNPIAARGRAALGLVALRRVRVEGSLALMRRFLAVIQI